MQTDNITINSTENTSSEIVFEEGIAKNIKNIFEDKNYFLITNTKIAKLYPEILYQFDSDNVIVIKDGEKYKDFKTCNFILNKLLERKIERRDSIVALGGGVVGDIAGFVASSVLRGVELIQIPTTLLAMCDSSIGGKTGYNSKYGKNLIGSFYLAKKVIIDIFFLNTLDEFQYKCGLGEILKYAFIEKSCKNQSYFNLIDILTKYQKDDVKADMQKIIKICASLKAGVVALDKKEGGLRKVLNFGHTFAHPIETLSHYKGFSHGEAVAIGMKYASNLALNRGLIEKDYFDKINFLIDKFELAKRKVKFKPQAMIEVMKSDKKVANKKINLLLPVGFAEVGLFDDIDLPSIEASML